LWGHGIVKDGQYLLNCVHKVRTYPAAVAALIKSSQPAMLEAPNHENTT